MTTLPRRFGVLLLPLLAAASVSSLAPAQTATLLDLRDRADDRTPLANPHKGWYHHFPDNHPDKYRIARDADLLQIPGMDHLYFRLAWSYLEPQEGRFDWSPIDREVEKWTAKGLGIAFRITPKETSVDRPEQRYATPRWVMEAGAKGGHYRMGQATGPDGPWEPDYGDPIFLEKLDRFLAAFAARYDGKPYVRYVDVGSIGDWGEGHSWAGSRKEVSLATRRAHLALYTKHFTKSQLIISDDFVHALTDPAERRAFHEEVIRAGLGYRDDSIMVNGYLTGMSDTFTVRTPEFFADAYRTRPNVLELEHYRTVVEQGNWTGRPGSNVAQHGGGKTGPDYFRGAVGLLHATYIGYHGDAARWYADNPELTAELLNRCGYWYFLHHVRVPGPLRAGAENELALTWENRGVAPAYHDYRLHVRLVAADGTVALDRDLDAGNRAWLPGKCEEPRPYRLAIPDGVKPGTYTLKVKLRSPEAGRDVAIALQPALRDADGFYRVGPVAVAGGAE
jgi:hypothetical protein